MRLIPVLGAIGVLLVAACDESGVIDVSSLKTSRTFPPVAGAIVGVLMTPAPTPLPTPRPTPTPTPTLAPLPEQPAQAFVPLEPVSTPGIATGSGHP